MKECERLKQTVCRTVIAGALPHLLYKTVVDDESQQKIKEIRKKRAENKDLSVVVYSNHIAVVDPLFAGNIAFRMDRKGTLKFVAPMSYSNTEDKPENKKTILLTKFIDMCGVETHRVIQKYQINSDEYGFSDSMASQINMPFLLRLRNLSKEKIPTCIIVFPEGHRTDGALIEGDEAMYRAGSLLAPVLFVPLGIRYEGDVEKNKLNTGKRVNLTIGDIYLQEKRTDSQMNYESLMVRLARTLPENMRGFYKDLAKMPGIRK